MNPLRGGLVKDLKQLHGYPFAGHSAVLGMSQIELAEKFGVSQPAVSAAVRKGERMVKKKGYE
ncbi:MAG: helix-turn-helix domain-containing protein [Desulfobacterales bacterium]